MQVAELAAHITSYLCDRDYIALAQASSIARNLLTCNICATSPCVQIQRSYAHRQTPEFLRNTWLPDQLIVYWAALNPALSTCEHAIPDVKSTEIEKLLQLEITLYWIGSTSLTDVIDEKSENDYEVSRGDWIQLN